MTKTIKHIVSLNNVKCLVDTFNFNVINPKKTNLKRNFNYSMQHGISNKTESQRI